MLFSGDDANKEVTVLSGGEKARAMFSKMMLTEGNFLIFDEPTDHLDLESITSLNTAFEQCNDCMFFTSHDFQLLETVSDRVIEVSPKGMLDRQFTFEEFMKSEQLQELRCQLYN